MTSAFAARGHNGICVPIQVREGTLESVMQGLTLIPNIDGLLVTMPHKFATYHYCATSSECSRLLQDDARFHAWPVTGCSINVSTHRLIH